jgi:hypothetical protein
LGNVGALREQAGVVDRGPRSGGELLGEQHVVGVQRPALLIAERERPKDAFPGLQRHRHSRTKPHAAQQLEMLIVLRDGGQQLVGDLRVDLRMPGSNDVRDADGSLGLTGNRASNCRTRRTRSGSTCVSATGSILPPSRVR